MVRSIEAPTVGCCAAGMGTAMLPTPSTKMGLRLFSGLERVFRDWFGGIALALQQYPLEASYRISIHRRWRLQRCSANVQCICLLFHSASHLSNESFGMTPRVQSVARLSRGAFDDGQALYVSGNPHFQQHRQPSAKISTGRAARQQQKMHNKLRDKGTK